VIFVSQYFKRLFVERFGYPAERGDVIYHGRDGLAQALDRSPLQQPGIRAPYLLSVSHLQPYKNIPALIEGYGLARQRLQARGLQLVLVGKPGGAGHLQKLKDLIRKLGLEDWVLLAGGVPHSAIGPLLAGCNSFVFQSTCENCPQTLIEALAAGVATACSRAGVMPEIAGDAALYFDPFAPREIAETLTRMSEDDSLRTQLRERARQQALQFPTWDEVGRLTVRSLERAVQGP
jgi:glycosyltransferase involved in cell wall biosynthesis